MSVTNETLVLLTELPLVRSVHSEKSISWFLVKTWILVPNHLRIVDLPRQNKCIDLCSMISTYSLPSFRPKFNFVLLDKSILLNHNQLILIILFAYDFFSFRITDRTLKFFNFVLTFSLSYSFQHESISLLDSLYLHQPFPLFLQLLNVQLIMHL